MKNVIAAAVILVLGSFTYLNNKSVVNEISNSVDEVENGYFKTFEDYENGKIIQVEKIEWKMSYVAAGCKFKMKKSEGDVVIRGDEMWGFKRGGVLFRCMPIYDGTNIEYSNRGIPLKVVKEGNFVYYEGGNFWWDYHGGKKKINEDTEEKFFKHYAVTNGSGYYRDPENRIKLGSASFVSKDLNSRVFPLSNYIQPVINSFKFKQNFNRKRGLEIDEVAPEEWAELIECLKVARQDLGKKDRPSDRLERLKKCAMNQI